MQSPEASLAEIVRSVYLERQTGAIEIPGDGRRIELFFRDGELHFERSHPRAAGLREHLDAAGTRPAAQPELRRLMTEMASELAGASGEPSFDADPRKLPHGELLGPLPTVCLVMELAVYELDERQLTARLGGEGARYRGANETPALQQLPGLDPEMAAVMAHLERPSTVAQLARGGGRLERLRGLAKLRAVGLAAAVSEAVEEAPERRAGQVSPKILKLFRKRIGEELETSPVGLPVEEHRALVADFVGRLGELDLYQLFGLEPGATSEEIHAAWERLAHRVHPSHARRLGFEGKEDVLEVLFERAVEAYFVLSDPRRRSSYHTLAGITIGREVDPKKRREEKRHHAEELYRQGLSYYSRADYSTAVDLLKEASRIAPKAEYLARLAQAQAKNPKWERHAVDSYHRAAQLAPDDPAIHAGFGEMLEALGRVAEARAEYRATLEIMPDHPGARAALDRIGKK